MHARDDEGFSLLELVIAMMLFAVIAVAILPAAIQATALSVANRDDAAANAFASAQLALVRSNYPDDVQNSCAAVQAQAVTGRPDPAETGLTATIRVAACPATLPGVVTITADVFDPVESATDPAVSMATQIVVAAP